MKYIRFYTDNNIYKGKIKPTEYRLQFLELKNWINSDNYLKFDNLTIQSVFKIVEIYRKNKTYYVTMNDSFMSNWGLSKNKINKLIFICDNYKQAEIVCKNANNRTDMKHINICSKKPYYNTIKYYIQEKTINDYPNWYKEGAF